MKAVITLHFDVVLNDEHKSFSSVTLTVEKRLVEVHAQASGNTIVGVFARDPTGCLFLTHHPNAKFDWRAMVLAVVYRVANPPASLDRVPDWSELGLSIVGKARVVFEPAVN